MSTDSFGKHEGMEPSFEIPEPILDGLQQVHDAAYGAGFESGVEQGRTEVERNNAGQIALAKREGYYQGADEQRQHFLGVLKHLETEHPEIVPYLPLDAIDLNDRQQRVLERRMGVHTLGQLMLKTSQDLTKDPLFGWRSLKEVKDKLEQHGLRLAPVEIPVDEGIVLREVYPSDSAAMFALIDRNRTHLSQHGDDTAAKYQSPEAMVERNANQHDREWRFNIWDGDSNVGFAKLTRIIGQPLEIGYYLGSEFQGRGHATKAVVALTSYATESLRQTKVIAKVAKSNAASLAVLQRAGYTITGEDPRHTDNYVLTFEPEAQS
ncbi:MAG: sle [Candidatus Saccharibacteria bacterium]|nr:sle [Candidatus Saccharibacteria bacterium]